MDYEVELVGDLTAEQREHLLRAAAHAGYAIGGAIALANGFNQMGQLYYSVAGAGLGVIAGFAGGALLLSPVFVLLEIATNTRK